MSKNQDVAQSRTPWAYWLVVPLFALGYTVFCLWFTFEAWGRRGEPKPVWFPAASIVALPGMVVPIFGPLMIGGAVGFGVVKMSLWRRRDTLRGGGDVAPSNGEETRHR